MRIPDEVLRCIAYVGVPRGGFERPEEMVAKGTGFFVTVPSRASAAVSHVYLVTARHVVEPLLGRNDLLIRVNKAGGGPFYGLAGDEDLRWWFHPSDENVDVAVAGWSPPAEVDYRAIPTNMFLTDDIIAGSDIGPGDEVFLAGLFVPLPGSDRNLPIVRVGHLAMMPTEPVPTREGPRSGYLVEAKSLGGSSGSPTFVRSSRGTNIYLLGLNRGHWNVSLNDLENLNMGISFIVPAKKIREVLERPELVGARAERDEEIRAKTAG